MPTSIIAICSGLLAACADPVAPRDPQVALLMMSGAVVASERDAREDGPVAPDAIPAPSPTPAPLPQDPLPQAPPAAPVQGVPRPAEPAPLPPMADSPVALPRVRVDVSIPAFTGRTITVAAGESVQDAIDAARPGDEVVLQAGATYTGSITLRHKEGGPGWITIRTSAMSGLPAAGQRVTPAHASLMPRLVAGHPTEPAIRTEPRASHYRLIGLEVTVDPSARQGGTLVKLGEDAKEIQNTRESQAHTLVLDRMYVHGTATFDFQRCIALNSAHTAIVDSWISDCHGKGKDSQAIGGWNGTGPYRIENNYLEGAGENVMFGGADPKIPNALPEDIEIRRNHFFKPLSWKGVWTVKNLFELKVGRRVLVEGNVFENNWADGQTGFAINLKSVNQSGGAPWSETSDITFRYNVVRNSANGVSLHASPESYPAVDMTKLYFAHNLFDDIGTGDFPGGRLFQITEVDDLTMLHNTGIGTHSFMMLAGSATSDRLVAQYNVFSKTTYGISGNGSGYGKQALDVRAPGWVFSGNVATGMSTTKYPPDNYYPATDAEAGLSTGSTGLMTLSSSSPYASAGPNGTALGVDMTALNSWISGVVKR